MIERTLRRRPGRWAARRHAAAGRPARRLLLALLGGLLCACAGEPGRSSEDEHTIRIGFGFGGGSLEGALAAVDSVLTADPLLNLTWDGRPAPRLAQRWEWLDDGRTLRLELRPSVTFHDGTHLDSEIAARTLREESARSIRGDRVDRVEPDGPHAVVISLRQPDAFLLGNIAETPIILDSAGGVGTGPYILKQREPSIVLERFERYYEGPPNIGRLVIQPYESQRAAWAAMMRKEVDFLYEVNRDAVDFLEAESGVRTYSFLRPYYIPIVFNMSHPILRQVEVRRALNEAVDKAAIVRTALGGRGRPADGPVWPLHWAYQQESRRRDAAVEAARVRLTAAGFPVRRSPQPGQMERRFQFTCLVWSGDPVLERVALVVQRQLFEIGIDMRLESVGLAEIAQRFESGGFEAVLFQLTSGRSLEWPYRFWRSSEPGVETFNRSGYKSADAALDRLRAARTDEETRAAVADLQAVLRSDPPAIFLVWRETARALNSRIEVPADAGPDILRNIWRWRVAETREARR